MGMSKEEYKMRMAIDTSDATRSLKFVRIKIGELSLEFAKINAEVAKLASSMTKSFKGISDVVEKANKDFSSFGKGTQQQSPVIVANVETIAKAFKFLATETINSAARFEDAMASIRRSASSASQAAMGSDTPLSERMMLGDADTKALQEKILDLYANTPMELGNLTKIFYEVSQAGISGTQSIFQVSEALAKLNFSIQELPASKLAEHVTMIGTGFGLSVDDYEKMGSAFVAAGAEAAGGVDAIIEAMRRFMPQATLFGMSFEQSTALMATLVAMGNPAERAGTQMGNALMEIATNAEEFAKVTSQSLETVRKDFESDEGIMGQIVSYLEKVNALKNPLDRAIALKKMFGKVGTKSMGLLGVALKKYLAILDDVNDAYTDGAILNQSYAIQTDTLLGTIVRLRNSFDVLKIRIGSALGDVLVPVLEKFQELILKVAGAWDSLDSKSKKTLVTFASIAASFTFLVPVLRTIKSLLSMIGMSPMGFAVAGIGSSVAALAITLSSEFSTLTNNAFTWGENFITSFFNGMMNVVNTGISILVNTLNGIAEYFRSNSPPKKGPLKDIEKWGTSIMETFLRAFGKADFTTLSNSMGLVETHMKRVGKEMEYTSEQIASNINNTKEVVTDLIHQLKITGDVSLDTQNKLIAAMGLEQAKGITAEASGAIDVETATTALESAQATLKSVLAARDRILTAGEGSVKMSQMSLDAATGELNQLRAMGKDMFDEEYREAYKRIKEAQKVLKEEQNKYAKERVHQDKKIDLVQQEVTLRQSELTEKKSYLDKVKALNKALLDAEKNKLNALSGSSRSGSDSKILPGGGTDSSDLPDAIAIDFPQIDEIFNNITEKIMNIIPEDVKIMISEFFTKLAELVNAVGDSFNTLVSVVITKIIPALTPLVGSIFEVLLTVMDGIARVALPALSTAFETFAWLIEVISPVLTVVVDLFNELLKIFIDFIQPLGPLIGQIGGLYGAFFLLNEFFKGKFIKNLLKVDTNLMEVAARIKRFTVATLFNLGTMLSTNTIPLIAKFGKKLEMLAYGSAGIAITSTMLLATAIGALVAGLLVYNANKRQQEMERLKDSFIKTSAAMIENGDKLMDLGIKSDTLRDSTIKLNNAQANLKDAFEADNILEKLRATEDLDEATANYAKALRDDVIKAGEKWGFAMEEMVDSNGELIISLADVEAKRKKIFDSMKKNIGKDKDTIIALFKEMGVDASNEWYEEMKQMAIDSGDLATELILLMSEGMTSAEAIAAMKEAGREITDATIEEVVLAYEEMGDTGAGIAFALAYGMTGGEALKTIADSAGSVSKEAYDALIAEGYTFKDAGEYYDYLLQAGLEDASAIQSLKNAAYKIGEDISANTITGIERGQSLNKKNLLAASIWLIAEFGEGLTSEEALVHLADAGIGVGDRSVEQINVGLRDAEKELNSVSLIENLADSITAATEPGSDSAKKIVTAARSLISLIFGAFTGMDSTLPISKFFAKFLGKFNEIKKKLDLPHYGRAIFNAIAGAFSLGSWSSVIKSVWNNFKSSFGNILIARVGSGLTGAIFKLLGFEEGGLVPEIQGYARGAMAGMKMTPSNTDTVPAMLTPGELILNAAQQKTLAGAISALVNGLSVPSLSPQFSRTVDGPSSSGTTNNNVTNISPGMMIASEGEIRAMVRMLDRYRKTESERYG